MRNLILAASLAVASPISAQVARAPDDTVAFSLALDRIHSEYPRVAYSVAIIPFAEDSDVFLEGSTDAVVPDRLLEARRAELQKRNIPVEQRGGRGRCPGSLVPTIKGEKRECPERDSMVVAVGLARIGGAYHPATNVDERNDDPINTSAIRILITTSGPYGSSTTACDVVLKRKAGQWTVYKLVKLIAVD